MQAQFESMEKSVLVMWNALIPHIIALAVSPSITNNEIKNTEIE